MYNKKNIEFGNVTIGVVAICFNEEVDLPYFLANVADWADEIIIVDSGSTDRTLDILDNSRFQIKLINSSLAEAGGYGGLRNVGIENCSTDWIIHMDIDERVSETLREEISKSIVINRFNAFRYYRLNYFLHRPMSAGGWNTWNYAQLARRGFHYFQGELHEKCIVDGGDKRTGQLKGVMLHFNDESYLERMDKSFRYCKLESEKLLRNGYKVNAAKLLFYPIFQFIKIYVLRRGFVDKTPGLIAALHSSCAKFRELAIVWDSQNKISRKELENDFTSY